MTLLSIQIPVLKPFRAFSTASTIGVLLRGPERSEGHVSSNDLVSQPVCDESFVVYGLLE